MFQDAFIKLDTDECQDVLKEINPALKGNDYDPKTVTVLGQELSFYPGYRFLDIADYGITPPFRKFVIHKPGDVVVLDWTNNPIYALSKRAPLCLTRETVVDYARFFFTYVRGPHGKFTVVENVDDIDWKEEPPPAARKAMGKTIQPMSITAQGPDGALHLNAHLLFRNALYRATVIVSKKGEVSLKDEEILVDDIPALDSAFGQ